MEGTGRRRDECPIGLSHQTRNLTITEVSPLCFHLATDNESHVWTHRLYVYAWAPERCEEGTRLAFRQKNRFKLISD